MTASNLIDSVVSYALQGTDIFTVARPVNPQGAVITRDQLVDGDDAEILLKVYEVTAGQQGAIIHSATLVADQSYDNPASSPVWSASLLTDYPTADGLGHVFLHRVLASAFTQAGGRDYVLEYVAQTTDWGPLKIVHRRKAQPVISA